jgi:hypothetical protein
VYAALRSLERKGAAVKLAEVIDETRKRIADRPQRAA